MKNKLDELTKKYETRKFIKSDPIQFPHKFKTKEDIEIAAFISSLFAFGRRDVFIKKLNYLFFDRSEIHEEQEVFYFDNLRAYLKNE